MARPPDPRDVAMGLASAGARAGLAAGRAALLPARWQLGHPAGSSAPPWRRAISPARDPSRGSAGG